MTSKSTGYKPNAATLRAEETTRVAFEHIAAETSARHEKQRLLKEARLKRDEVPEPKSPKRARGK